MSSPKYTPKMRGDSIRRVCADASLRTFDPFHDYRWEWKPWKRYSNKRRRLRTMSYRQLVEFMLAQ